MTEAQAHTTITTSAVIVAATYAYRRLIEKGGVSQPSTVTGHSSTSVKQLAGAGAAPPLAHFVVGYGFAFVVISALAQADPDTGAAFAIMLMAGTLLLNGIQIFTDISTSLGQGAPQVAIQPGTASAVTAAGSAVAAGAQLGGTVAGLNVFGSPVPAVNLVPGVGSATGGLYAGSPPPAPGSINPF